jgi:hypothetical protein
MSYATILIPSSGIVAAYTDERELSNALGIYLITCASCKLPRSFNMMYSRIYLCRVHVYVHAFHRSAQEKRRIHPVAWIPVAHLLASCRRRIDIECTFFACCH